MITRVNEARHRLLFRVWCAWLDFQLRRRGGRLVVDAPYGARMDSWPHVEVARGSVRLRVGRGVKLGRATHLDVQGGGTLELGDAVYLMHGVRLQLRGGTIRLGPGTHVRDATVLKSAGELLVGEEVTIGYGDVLACVERVIVGDRCGLGERVSITDSDHTHDGSLDHYLDQPLRVTPVVLGENVLVSANVVIARGARLGDASVIGANAVVTAGDHPARHLLTGAPARPIRPL